MGASQSSGGGGSQQQQNSRLAARGVTNSFWKKNTQDKFQTIRDNFQSIDEVQGALREAGLESSQLIFGLDFTKSNEWAGKYSFSNRCLHDVMGGTPNPYEEAISIVAKTMRTFDDDNLIPCYGFGDATTRDTEVFHFYADGRPCRGIDEALWRYRAIAPHVNMAGPTSFAPLILEAVEVVRQSGNQYHILVLIADGQVTRSIDLPSNQLSPQEAHTIQAIEYASNFPLSIVMVGVGDGPWDQMITFDDHIKNRRFDNFQFVDFHQTKNVSAGQPQNVMEARFAVRALMEIPFQFQAIQALRLLGQPGGARPPQYRMPLPPPQGVVDSDRRNSAGGPSSPPGHAPPPPPGGGGAVQYAQPPGASGSGGGGGAAGGATGAAAASAAAAAGAAGAGGDTPAMFLCPITTELMTDPVMCADGYTYEKAAIAQWLESHNTSPMSNALLEHQHLIPNHQLRSAIMDYKAAGGR